MNKTKTMLIGLMLCGAISVAGGAATLRGYDAEPVSVCAETSAFTETETTVSIYGYNNFRIGFALGTSDYANTNQDFTKDMLSELNTLTSITYNGNALGETLDASSDGKIYLQMWTQPNTIYFPVAQPVEGDVIKIAAGTQFPSSAYITDSSNKTCYVVQEESVYKFDGTSWVKKVDFTEEETSVTKIHLRGTNRLLFFLGGHDYTEIGATKASTSYANYNTLEKVQIYIGETCVTLKEALAKSGDGDTNVYYNVWAETGSISYPLTSSTYTSATVTKIVIPEGTEFPSVDGGVAYVTKKAQVFLNNTPAASDAVDWVESVIFTERDTTASVFTYANDRIGFRLSENDLPPSNDATTGDPILDNCNVQVSAQVLKELNLMDKVTVNGKTLRSLWNNDVAYFNMFANPNSFFFPLAEPAVGTQIVIPKGTQFPSYGYVTNKEAIYYTTTADVKYVLTANGWFRPCSVTFDDGDPVTAYIGAAIPADVIPATPTKEATETLTYTFGGWYNGTEKWDMESAVTGDLTLTSKFTESARKYKVTYKNEDGSEYQTSEVANGATLTLIDVPEKLGYTGVWKSDAAYETMPTKDIVYQVEYTLETYEVTFMADGEEVETVTYTVENKTIDVPEVPKKEGFTGEWEAYELTTGNVTVNAVYTAIPDSSSSESSSESSESSTSETSSNSSSNGSTSSDKSSDSSSGNVLDELMSCFSGIGGVAGGMVAFGAAASILLKKKKDEENK